MYQLYTDTKGERQYQYTRHILTRNQNQAREKVENLTMQQFISLAACNILNAPVYEKIYQYDNNKSRGLENIFSLA